MSPRVLALAGVGIAAIAPRRAVSSLPTICAFRMVTGRPCPTCGMTRSWNAVAHGNVGDAVRLHPFGPPTFLLGLAIAVAGPGILDRPVLRSTPVITVLTVAWVGVWLARFARRSGGRGS